MKKFVAILFVLGFILYLKPEFKFPHGTNWIKVKTVSGEATTVASVGQAGRIIKVVGEDSKRYYIPVDNILYIIED